MDIADIEQMIADYQPPSEPFNGATNVFLGSVAYEKIVPLMHAFDRRKVSVELRVMMRPEQGVGFRPTLPDDPEWLVVPDYGTLVWTMSEQEPR